MLFRALSLYTVQYIELFYGRYRVYSVRLGQNDAWTIDIGSSLFPSRYITELGKCPWDLNSPFSGQNQPLTIRRRRLFRHLELN